MKKVRRNMYLRFRRSMGGAGWVGCDKGSSLFEEIVEFSIFSSGVVVLSDLVDGSRNSDIDFCDFLETEFLPRTQSFLLFFRLFPD